MSERYAYIMMIREKWWNEFRRLNRAGKTVHSYVRKGPAAPKEANLIFFYVVKPVGEIQGYAEFQERLFGDAEEIWKKYGHETCLESEDAYYELLNGWQKVTFIRFKNLQETTKPIPLNNLLTILRTDKIGRNGFYKNKGFADKLIKMME